MESLIAQPRADAQLRAALENPRHAYLLHGPPGCGVDEAANAFAAALVGTDLGRVERDAHPDVVIIEPEGEVISIDAIRRLRADLALRPFEAERRVYLIRQAERLHQDAANALLKSLEEPPSYVVIILACGDRARLLPTIASRCQVVRFQSLPPDGIVAALGGSASARDVAVLARGDLALARLLVQPAELARFERLIDIARDAVVGRDFDPGSAAAEVMAIAKARGEAAEREVLDRLDELRSGMEVRDRASRALQTQYEATAKRRRRRAETDYVRLAIDVVSAYWRDALCSALGAADIVVHRGRAEELTQAGQTVGQVAIERVLLAAREVRRTLDLPVVPLLALEALFHRLAMVRGAGIQGG